MKFCGPMKRSDTPALMKITVRQMPRYTKGADSSVLPFLADAERQPQLIPWHGLRHVRGFFIDPILRTARQAAMCSSCDP